MIPYTTCQKCREVLDAANRDANGSKHPADKCDVRCCHRDTDADGNCPVHIRKGVLRKTSKRMLMLERLEHVDIGGSY